MLSSALRSFVRSLSHSSGGAASSRSLLLDPLSVLVRADDDGDDDVPQDAQHERRMSELDERHHSMRLTLSLLRWNCCAPRARLALILDPAHRLRLSNTVDVPSIVAFTSSTCAPTAVSLSTSARSSCRMTRPPGWQEDPERERLGRRGDVLGGDPRLPHLAADLVQELKRRAARVLRGRDDRDDVRLPRGQVQRPDLGRHRHRQLRVRLGAARQHLPAVSSVAAFAALLLNVARASPSLRRAYVARRRSSRARHPPRKRRGPSPTKSATGRRTLVVERTNYLSSEATRPCFVANRGQERVLERDARASVGRPRSDRAARRGWGADPRRPTVRLRGGERRIKSSGWAHFARPGAVICYRPEIRRSELRSARTISRSPPPPWPTAPRAHPAPPAGARPRFESTASTSLLRRAFASARASPARVRAARTFRRSFRRLGRRRRRVLPPRLAPALVFAGLGRGRDRDPRFEMSTATGEATLPPRRVRGAREGKARILTNANDVFFNKAQVVNRDFPR